MSSLAGWVTSLAAGTVLWSIASLLLEGREPWDAPGYWSLWYPLALLIAAVLGCLFPRRPWRWPIAVMLVQLPVMLFIAGGDGGLLPLGALLLLVLAVPGMLAAAIGAAIGRHLRRAEGT